MLYAVIILTLGIICFVVRHYEVKLKKEKSKISFKESIDLIELPIVTLYNRDNKLNFLLDTGSTDSHISVSASTRIEGESSEYKMEVVGYGTSEEAFGKAIKAFLKYKDKEYESLLHVSPHLDKSFEELKSAYGVQLHGILGGDFLQKHRYVLDFAELIAYSK